MIRGKRINKIIAFMLTFVLSFGMFTHKTSTFAEGNYEGADLVDDLSVSHTEINHTGDFSVNVRFSGQSENSGEDKYIYPGKKIIIPIVGDGISSAELNSQLPQMENARITADSNGIVIEFLEGIENQHDIEGNFTLTFSGLNAEEGSTRDLTIGNQHVVKVTNTVGGTRGVFAGKTGMMYGASNPGYVTWFLRGNINGDSHPGGPLIIKDKLGEGQILDGTGISIALYWGGQQFQTYVKTFDSIESFLADSEYGSSVGSSIEYNKETGEIDIHIPESVLNGREFAFTYDALITDESLKEYTNDAKFEFHENNVKDQIETTAVVQNVMSDGNISGKTRASIKINKVVKGTNVAIPGVEFEFAREDGTKLFNDKEDLKAVFTTDNDGEINASGFRPGKLLIREINAPEWVSYDSREIIELDLKAGREVNVQTIENEIKKIDIPVRKVWNDKNNQDGMRSESVTVKLFANGEDTNKEVILNESNNWSSVFQEIDEFDSSGNKIDYSVKEVEVDGYTTSISGDTNNGFVITNTHEVEKIDVSGLKTWNDKNNQDGKRPETITVNLLKNGVKVDSKTVSENDDWTWTFTDLDKFEDGSEINYAISEDKVEDFSTEIEGYNLINSYTPGKTSVTVSKSWNDKNNQDGIRSEFVTIKLLADGKETDKNLILNEENNWTATFNELDEYQNGKKIEYSVEEAEVDGYTTSISGDMNNGFVITNTHEVEKIEVSGLKTWNDKNNQDGKRPETITVNLLKNGVKVDSKTVSENDDWTWTFTDLDKFEDGSEINYAISEDKVEDYSTEIDGYDIINTYTPGKTSVSVSKSWDDNNNKDGLRPDSIIIKLIVNGEESDKILVLSEENNWIGTFTELDEYVDGEKIVYTVEEVKVDSYETSISGDMDNGFVVTNTQETEDVLSVSEDPKKKPNVPETPKTDSVDNDEIEEVLSVSELPQTGMSTSIMVYLGLILVFSGGMLFALRNRKKEVK